MPYDKIIAKVRKHPVVGYRIDYSQDGDSVIAVTDGTNWALTMRAAGRRARAGVKRRARARERDGMVLCTIVDTLKIR